MHNRPQEGMCRTQSEAPCTGTYIRLVPSPSQLPRLYDVWNYCTTKPQTAPGEGDERSQSCLRVRVECWKIQVPTPIPRVGASRCKQCPLFNSAGAYNGGRLRQVGADSLSKTVYQNDFLILVSSPGIGVGTWICLHYTRTQRHDFQRKVFNIKCVFWFSIKFYLQYFSV